MKFEFQTKHDKIGEKNGEIALQEQTANTSNHEQTMKSQTIIKN